MNVPTKLATRTAVSARGLRKAYGEKVVLDGETNPGRHGGPGATASPAQDPAVAKLVTTSVGVSSPAWDRLTEIGRERLAGGGR